LWLEAEGGERASALEAVCPGSSALLSTWLGEVLPWSCLVGLLEWWHF
jgi:hypothetical protein